MRFWDTNSWTPKENIASGGVGWRLAYARDGQSLAVADRNQVQLWNLHGQTWVSNSVQHFEGLRVVALSKRFLAAGDIYGGLALWDVATGRQVVAQKAHQSILLSMVFSPNEQILATASADQCISLWDVRQVPMNGATAGVLTKLQTLRGHLDQVRGLAFTSDGTLLASASADQTAKLWNVLSAVEMREFQDCWHPLWFSSDANRMITLNSDQSLSEWNIAERRVTRTMNLSDNLSDAAQRVVSTSGGHGNDLAAAVSPDGKTLAVGIHTPDGANQSIEIWDLATPRRAAMLPLSLAGKAGDLAGPGLNLGNQRLVISPRNASLAVASPVDLRLFNLSNRQEQAPFTIFRDHPLMCEARELA